MELGKLPEGWSMATVGEVATLLRGVTYSKDQASTSPQIGMKPILRGNNINGELNFDDLVYVPEALIAPEQVISAGDIIFAMSSGSKHLVGKSAKARISFDGGFGAFCGLLRATEGINKDFLHYVFQGSDFRRAISEVSKGSNINNLKREHILDFEFSCPPLAEQHRIVAKIEELFSELDQGVASLKTAREQLKVYRQSLLKHAFEGKLTAAWRAAHRDELETAAALQQRIAREREARYQQQLADWQAAGKPGPKPKAPKPLPPLATEELALLPELPEGWGWARLLDACEAVVDCHNKTAPYLPEGIPLVRTPSIRDMRLNFDDSIRYISRETYAHWSRRCPPLPGDILFTREAPMGEAALIPEGKMVCMGQRIMLLRPGKFLSGKYLLCATQNPIFKKISDKVAVGTGVKHLRVGDVERLVFPVCSQLEQQEIADQLDAKLSEADQLDQTLATALQQAHALRQSILKKAFCGQLVPQDKNDEPAAALLERIRANREAAPAKGRRAKMVSTPLPVC